MYLTKKHKEYLLNRGYSLDALEIIAKAASKTRYIIGGSLDLTIQQAISVLVKKHF